MPATQQITLDIIAAAGRVKQPFDREAVAKASKADSSKVRNAIFRLSEWRWIKLIGYGKKIHGTGPAQGLYVRTKSFGKGKHHRHKPSLRPYVPPKLTANEQAWREFRRGIQTPLDLENAL